MRWSEEEDKILLENVKLSSKNLRKAFRLTAIELNRTPASANGRWYRALGNPTSNKYVGTTFLLLNREGSDTYNPSEKIHISLWRKLFIYLKQLLTI